MQKILGLVLKKQNLGETDRIITIFSPSLGKKRIIARAVRQTKSKLAGHLDTLMLSQLMLTDHPDLPKVTAAELVEPFERVRGSLVDLERAFAITKIIERVVLEDVNQQSLFQLTLDALARMNGARPWPNVWLYFLGSLVNQLGLAITEFRCDRCGGSLKDGGYWLYHERRFMCENCGATDQAVRLQGNSVKLLGLLQGQAYSTIEKIRFNEAVATEVEEVLLREITEWFTRPWVSYASLRNR